MPRVIILLADGFEEIEAMAVADVLRRAEQTVVMAGLRPGQVTSARNISVIPDETIDAVKAEDYDMMILPGGQPGTKNLAADKRVLRLLKSFSDAGKIIGAICAATTVLAEAGIISQKKVTCYPSYSNQLSDAIYENKAVVIDSNIITSQGPGTAIQFALAIVARLAGAHTAQTIEKAMLVPSTEPPQTIWTPNIINSTIQSLIWALEMADPHTQGHTKRVSEYALGIGAKLNMSEIEMRDLYLGAMLHDVGKIATEQSLLRKPDTLNLREETIIREHPLKGTLFIVGIDSLTHILPTILHHHERWDGTGYPDRLKSDAIPLHARIISIADAFSAMQFPRSFRQGMDKETAISEIQKEKGKQFDPLLVDLLIQSVNETPFGTRDFSYYFP